MLIQLNAKGFELNPKLRDDAEKSIGTVLDKFSSRITRVNVFLEDVNGPKNGRDKSLRVIIDIERAPLIVVEEKGDAWHAMFDRATERAVHTVSRRLDRIRSRSDRTSMAGDADEPSEAELDELEWNPLRRRPESDE